MHTELSSMLKQLDGVAGVDPTSKRFRKGTRKAHNAKQAMIDTHLRTVLVMKIPFPVVFGNFERADFNLTLARREAKVGNDKGARTALQNARDPVIGLQAEVSSNNPLPVPDLAAQSLGDIIGAIDKGMRLSGKQIRTAEEQKYNTIDFYFTDFGCGARFPQVYKLLFFIDLELFLARKAAAAGDANAADRHRGTAAGRRRAVQATFPPYRYPPTRRRG